MHHKPSSRRHASFQAHAAPSARRPHGFTLIEVMVTVAIVAILAGIAIPSYTDYIRRGQLPEAFGALSDYRVKMEQYYQDNRNYGVAACADVNPPSWNGFAAQKYFRFTCTLSGGGQQYTLTAQGATGRAVGHTYTLTTTDALNPKHTTFFKGAASTKACWLVRGDEC